MAKRGSTEDEKKSSQLSALLRLVRLVRPYRGRFYFASVFLLLGSVVSLAYPQVARYAIDLGMREGDTDAFNNVLTYLFAIFACHAVFVWFRHYLMSWLGIRAVADLRSLVFDRIMLLPIAWFHDRRSGELVGRLAADVAVIEEVIGSQLSMAVRNVVQLIGGVALLLVVDWKLTMVMLAIIPPFSVAAVFFGGKLRKRSKVVQDKLAEASGRVQEAIAAIDTVQAFGRERDEASAYRLDVEAAFQSGLRLVKWRASFMSSVSVLTYAALAVILALGGRSVIAGELTAGELTAFLIYTGMVASSFGTVASLYGSLSRAAGATERLYDVVDEVPEIRDPEDPQDLPEGQGAVHFESIDFHYASRPDDAVLRGVDIKLEVGQVVALVGPSGAGKTTIASLLPRFYDVQGGQVTLEGVDVRRLRLGDLRGAIAVVAQEPVLFSGTIRDNIAYSDQSLSQAQVERAAVDANAHVFIQSFPEGYGTKVGERGVKLSGGQKQRIAIARAIVADPRVLILDEATSNLDSESEAAVQQALAKLMKGRTTLVIAHRLSTVRDADRICVVEGGATTAQGTHQELMNSSATYRRLVEHQLLEPA
ncbi:MAG: ATP-binding cassette domain-containing protein [Myxococcales bacterium]|nr:ATP-binding cassette domain-containing protein [Myxococcales bacterium]